MLQFFLLDLTNKGNYYTVGMNGDDKEEIEHRLQKHFRDVRFIYSKEKKPRDKFNGKRVLDGLEFKSCKHSFDLGTNRSEYVFAMTPDSRHQVG